MSAGKARPQTIPDQINGATRMVCGGIVGNSGILARWMAFASASELAGGSGLNQRYQPPVVRTVAVDITLLSSLN